MVLTAGRPIYGVAVDDSHHFQVTSSLAWRIPGRGWVMVDAPALEQEAVVEALESGAFYSSTALCWTSWSSHRTESSLQSGRNGTWLMTPSSSRGADECWTVNTGSGLPTTCGGTRDTLGLGCLAQTGLGPGRSLSFCHSRNFLRNMLPPQFDSFVLSV